MSTLCSGELKRLRQNLAKYNSKSIEFPNYLKNKENKQPQITITKFIQQQFTVHLYTIYQVSKIMSLKVPSFYQTLLKAAFHYMLDFLNNQKEMYLLNTDYKYFACR